MKLGRRPRAYRADVPHYSAVIAGQPALPPPPLLCDWSKGMPDDFGMMLNDQIGDCTAAAYFHATQIWSFNTGGENPVADSEVQAFYSATTGYNPADPTTDQGGVEQDILAYLLKNNEIDAFVEVDTRNQDDMRRVINDCGVAYIGINLPSFILANGEPPAVWNAQSNAAIDGGHAVILCGYTMDGFWLISWGKKYFMSSAFFANYCDEAYAIADPTWCRVKQTTPADMTLEDLEAQMQAMRATF